MDVAPQISSERSHPTPCAVQASLNPSNVRTPDCISDEEKQNTNNYGSINCNPEGDKNLPANKEMDNEGPEKSGSNDTSIEEVMECEGDAKGRKLAVWQVLVMVTLCVAAFCNWASIAIIAPFFPIEAEKKGISATVVGFMVGIFYLAMLLSSSLFGYLTPFVGSRRMIIIGTLLAGIFTILFGAVEYVPDGLVFTVLCFLVRSLQATSCSAVITASFACTANCFRQNTPFYLSLLEACSALGLSAGPFIGGSLYQIGGFGVPCYVSGCMILATFVASIFTIPCTADTSETENDEKFGILKLLKNIDVTIILCLAVLDTAFQGFLETTLAPHLAYFNLHPTYVGLMFLLSPIVYVAASPVFGFIFGKYGYLMTVMIAGSIINAACLFFIGPASFISDTPVLWMTIVALGIAGLGSAGTFLSPMISLSILALNKGYPDNLTTHGIVGGIFFSAFSLGGFVGSSLSGILVDSVGFGWAGVVLGSLFLVNALMLAGYALSNTSGGKDIFYRQDVIADSGIQEVAPVKQICNDQFEYQRWKDV